MITVLIENCKPLTQEIYDFYILELDIHQLTCSCGISAHLIKHAYYSRYLKIPEEKVELRILRLRCKICKKTHALLPSEIVPYSQTQLSDQIEIIEAYESQESLEPIMEKNPSIDESNVGYIIRNYLRNWKERIKSICLSVTDDFLQLVTQCFIKFGRQFMQIKSTPNVLLLQNHIS